MYLVCRVSLVMSVFMFHLYVSSLSCRSLGVLPLFASFVLPLFMSLVCFFMYVGRCVFRSFFITFLRSVVVSL